MKWMIASDIHGSAYYCRLLLDAFGREQADRLLILGDLLYHGPRNPLPEGYAPMEVAHMLNSVSDRIICVHGNCDAEVDQMVLDFPITTERVIIPVGSRAIFALHGHINGEDDPPLLNEGDILLHGHTHIPAYEDRGSFIYCNPGSVSLPKGGSSRGYMLLTEDRLVWKTLDGETFMEHVI